MNKKFCPVPWVYGALKNNGDFRVCCHSSSSAGQGTLKKSDNTVFNIATDSFADARQSQLMNDVRLSMLNNETNIICSRCDTEELAGMRSRRQYENERAVNFSYEKALAITNPNGSLQIEEAPVNYMDLRFGNRCNLKCRMCGPTDSELWYDDYVNLWKETQFNDGGERIELNQSPNGKWQVENDKYRWVDRVEAWLEIKKNLHNLEYIYIVGGEPLLIIGHVDLLKACIAKNVSTKITLEYNTNLTIVPDEILELWKNFKAVRIGISIDGIGKVNDYIRSPSKWKQIESNFKKLMSQYADANFEVWFSLTYQAYNAFHVIDVFEWIKDKFILSQDTTLNQISLRTHPLHRPNHLSVKIFPTHVKEEITQKYLSYINDLELEYNNSYQGNLNFKHFKKTTTKALNAFIKFMKDEDLSNQFDEFLRFTKELDNIRTENISTSIPEIGKFINGTV